MRTPKIRAGIWFRNAEWPERTSWRTDIPASVLASPKVSAARYALRDGPVLQIPISDLRHALADSRVRESVRKVGPFNIDPFNRVLTVWPRHTKNRIEFIVRMEFGPFTDLDRDEIHRREAGYFSRPSVPSEFYQMADIILDRIHSGSISFDDFVDRIEALNPALLVVRASDGSVSRGEIAYVLRVSHLRAVFNFEQELLYANRPNA